MKTPDVSKNIDRIRAFSRKEGVNRFDLAERAGLSRGALREMFKPDWNPTKETILSIERVIPEGWTPSEGNDTGASTMEAAE